MFFSLSLSQDTDIVLKKLNSTDAIFTENEISRAINKLSVDSKNISEISKNILEKSICVGKNDKGERIYTGKKYRKLEYSVLSKFQKLSQETMEVACNPKIISDVLEKHSYMNLEQQNAIVGICGKRKVDILIGKAGSGKTTTLKAIAEIYNKSGFRVIGASLSALASENLGKAAGIEAHSISYWIHNKWKLSQNENESSSISLKPGDVIIIDESGMVGTSDWQKIFNASKKFKTKLIIVGDQCQFKPIAAGDCFRLFMQILKNKYFELKNILRQKIKWMKNASVEFSKLHILKALKMYNDRNRIHYVDDAISAASEKYLQLEKSGETFVLCYSKSECALYHFSLLNIRNLL